MKINLLLILTVFIFTTFKIEAQLEKSESIIFSKVTSNSLSINFSSQEKKTKKLLILSLNQSLASYPVDGKIYSVGDEMGDGIVVANDDLNYFETTNLSPSTHYFIFVINYSINEINNPIYSLSDIKIKNVLTLTDLQNCSSPINQPINLVLKNTLQGTIEGHFDSIKADEYLVVMSLQSKIEKYPLNGKLYNVGDSIGNGVVVSNINRLDFVVDKLQNKTNYYFYVFSFNDLDCSNGPFYNTIEPLQNKIASVTKLDDSKFDNNEVKLVLTPIDGTIYGSFNAIANAKSYLVIKSESPQLNDFDVKNHYNVGDKVANGIVISNNLSTQFTSTNLIDNTTYYYFVFPITTEKYKTLNNLLVLKANATANIVASNNFYFGNLHSHSDYSDGNKDNHGFTPTEDYNFAMSSQCLDYLGISEHNHFSAANNPGNNISNFHLGSIKANTFNTSHSNFVALYGMEWGVISGGGHVIVYGDGMDSLFGWETGSGSWGPSNNYDIFVAKSDYTGTNGLFKNVVNKAAQNTFATLAHPATTDYNNLIGVAYNSVADNAISGCAVETGPAFSTDVTYTDPGASLSFYSYFKNLLSKGYHIGPTIDHDNHYTTFGRTTKARTAIIAPSLSKTELIKGMSSMHFYATEDCALKINFTINSQIMGSIFTDRLAPKINVILTNAINSVASATIKLYFGVPGSGTSPALLNTVTGSTLNFTDTNLTNLKTGYYFVEIINASLKAISSPIWYTRLDSGAVLKTNTKAIFEVVKQENSVKLNLTLPYITDFKNGMVEHSNDGQNWENIQTVNENLVAKNQSVFTAIDDSPNNGINYYRIKQSNLKGSFDYTEVKSIIFEVSEIVKVYPNPARDFIIISFDNQEFDTVLELKNLDGKTLKTVSTNETNYQLNTSDLAKGFYFLNIKSNQKTITIKVIIE